jgi:ABC-type antimicrobial peptide transport system permease subunit
MYGVPSTMTLVVKATGDPAALGAPIRRAVRDADASMPVSLVATMDRVVGDSIASRRFATALLAAFAVLALTLAGIGIYGVIAYGVSQRRYEIGIRVAMGAPRRSIIRLVLDEAGVMTVAGVVIGIVGAAAVQHFIRAMLVGVTPGDVPTFLGVVASLSAVALAACVVPARRATSVSPTEALRDG